MARIRTIKPELFKHERLYDLEKETGLPVRLVFIGLFTQCDREGRFEWRPRQLKTDILPYDDVEFSRVLHALATREFIVKYASNGREYGQIPSWKKHQVVNNREKASELPEPPELLETKDKIDASSTRTARVTETHVHALAEGKGKERKGKEEECAIAPFEDSKIHDPPSEPPPPDQTKAGLERQLFVRGKEVLGSSAGGMIKKLLTAKEGSVAQARAAIETASEKENPREYIGAILRNDGEEDVQAWTDNMYREMNVS